MSNRLSMERSPYLLQHMDNPVDWWPWGPEVFRKARRTDKPIFLSIGYSTCHWCHVMAHESFEDEAATQTINAAFLPVKTVLLTPEQKPFWVGTYLPKAQLLHLVHEAARLWREDRAGLRSGRRQRRRRGGVLRADPR